MSKAKIIGYLLFLLLICLAVPLTVAFLIDWLLPTPHYDAPGVTEVVIDQGKQVEIPVPEPPGEPIIQPSQPRVEVKTEVTQKPLSLLSQYPSLSLSDAPGIQPTQAVVVREVDSQGNTTITVLTPVKPALEEQESRDETAINTSTVGEYLDPGETWYITEIVVTIHRERSRLKPIAGVSTDGDIEPGIAYELAQLHERPPWLPEKIYNLIDYASIDILATTHRVGLGVSVEVYTSDLVCIDLGVAGTLQFRPNIETEIFFYGSLHF